jgi:trans-2,3-dihydro-3-hydroxyanthranilate isomerase
MTQLRYHHVDVFSPRPYAGNSLSVFSGAAPLSTGQMLAITQEMRHFESIFLQATESTRRFRARVFDLVEELDFAGHPILGAASVAHSVLTESETEEWVFELNHKTVTVTTRRTANGFSALLDQGTPSFHGELPHHRRAEFAAALNLEPGDLSERFTPEVVSTGLRYLVVPVDSGLDRVRVVARNFDALLSSVNAQYAYVVDLQQLEGRHWTNDGLLEDIATGSGAGTAAAYLVRHGVIEPNVERILQQGRFAGRPSEIRIQANGTRADIRNVLVGGDVTLVGHGSLHVLPAKAA